MSCHDMARLEQGVAAWLPMREWQFLDVKGGEIMYHLGGRALRCGV